MSDAPPDSDSDCSVENVKVETVMTEPLQASTSESPDYWIKYEEHLERLTERLRQMRKEINGDESLPKATAQALWEECKELTSARDRGYHRLWAALKEIKRRENQKTVNLCSQATTSKMRGNQTPKLDERVPGSKTRRQRTHEAVEKPLESGHSSQPNRIRMQQSVPTPLSKVSHAPVPRAIQESNSSSSSNDPVVKKSLRPVSYKKEQEDPVQERDSIVQEIANRGQPTQEALDRSFESQEALNLYSQETTIKGRTGQKAFDMFTVFTDWDAMIDAMLQDPENQPPEPDGRVPGYKTRNRKIRNRKPRETRKTCQTNRLRMQRTVPTAEREVSHSLVSTTSEELSSPSSSKLIVEESVRSISCTTLSPDSTSRSSILSPVIDSGSVLEVQEVENVKYSASEVESKTADSNSFLTDDRILF